MPLNRNQDFMFEDTTTLTTNAKSLKGALNEVNASLAANASIQNEDTQQTTMYFLQNANNIRTRSILSVQGFYSVDDDVYGKYRVLSVTGSETWSNVKDSNNNTIFQISSIGELRSVGATKKFRVMSKDGRYNVKLFGAKGDGVTNDTLSAQSAIYYAESLGVGTIIFPQGTYWTKSDSTQATGNTGDGSSTPAGSCLMIRGNNITILGEGKDKTKIVCHSPSGQLNESSFAVLDFSNIGTNKVWRGGGIGIMGGTSSQPQQNITIRGIELDGTAHYTGNYNYPANTSTGDGWDITHRGVWLNPDTYISNVMVDDCYIHSFKGELTYSAGTNITKLYLQNSTLDDSNAEASNFADGYIKNNIIGQMAIGFEPCPLSNFNMVIKDNKLNGPFAKGGISGLMYDNITGKSGTLICEDNQVFNAVTGILIQEVRNTTVRNNLIVDSSTYAMRFVTNANSQPKPFSNCVVENNKIIQKTVSITNAISFLLDTYGATKSKVLNNQVILDDQATGGVSINMPFTLDSGTFDNTCEVNGNNGKGTTNRTVDSMVIKNALINTTSNFTLFQYNNPPMDKLYRVEITYRVVTACNVSFSVFYKDMQGNMVTQTILLSTAKVVGTYSEPAIMIHAQSGLYIQGLAVTSVANAVYVSAKLSEV